MYGRIRENAFPLFFVINIPVRHLFVYKVLKLFYIESINNDTENLLYKSRRNLQKTLDYPKANKICRLGLYRKNVLNITLGPNL